MNCHEWLLCMQLKMQARHIWDAVEFDDVEFDDDRSALNTICSAVLAEIVPALATKATAKEAWEAIKKLCIGDDRVRKATAQNLRAEYDAIALRDGEAIEDFALHLTDIVQRLATLGDPELDTKVVTKYLHIVRPRYKQLVISIETLLDISQLSIEEVTGWLKAADDVEPTPSQAAGGKLLLTEEQWLERYKQKGTESGRGGSSAGGWGKRRGKPCGRGGGNSKDAHCSASTVHASPDDECKRCGKKGHWAQNCRGKLKVEEQAHVAHDDEPTLMYIFGTEDSSSSSTPSLSTQPLPPFPNTDAAVDAAPMPHQLELVEANVLAGFDATEDRDPKRWALDTGATKHMTGSRSAFSDLNTGIVGTVRFGDGSLVKIEGRGTILFACKNGSTAPSSTHTSFPASPRTSLASTSSMRWGSRCLSREE
jgi:hypothetical protein